MSQRRRQTSSILIRLCRHTWSERHHGIREVEDESGKVKFEYSIDKNSAGGSLLPLPAWAVHARRGHRGAQSRSGTGWAEEAVGHSFRAARQGGMQWRPL
jgi:hypothetical protein